MGKVDFNFQVIYRGEALQTFAEGGWVFFQRAKEYGGGFWLGRTYHDCFLLEFCHPISLSDGMEHMNLVMRVEARSDDFEDMNYSLF